MFRILTLAFAIFASQAFAQFQPAETEETLYLDFPDLALEYEPGSEFRVHAIVNSYTDRAIYVITREYRGRIIPFGAFECGTEFTYLSSSTNGFRDILCVTTDGVLNRITTILRVINNAGYEETLP